jgi:4,5-DOPA dioxygenase extradiol
LLPLHFAVGAGGNDAKATRIHKSASHGIPRMDAYAFE